MRGIIAIIIWVLGVILGLYVGGWLLFVKPIWNCCLAFDSGTLTGLMIGGTILKCILGNFVGGIIYLVGHCIAMFIVDK